MGSGVSDSICDMMLSRWRLSFMSNVWLVWGKRLLMLCHMSFKVSVTHLNFSLPTLLHGGSHGLSEFCSECLSVSNVLNLTGCCLSNLNVCANLFILQYS